MKVALIGTHGTFKTVTSHDLCVALKVKKKKIKLIDEVAGNCPYEINGKDIRAQKWIIVNQYSKEMEAEQPFNGNRTPPDIIVCDRSTLDAYVYTVDLCRKQGIEIPQWTSKLTRESLDSYDFLFKTDIIPGGLFADGTRDVDPVWQREIFDLLNHYLAKWDIKHYCLPTSAIAGIENPSSDHLSELRKEQVKYIVNTIFKKKD